MSTPTFAEIHNLIAFLEKPTESEGFEHIIYFLNANPIKYALTVSLTIYTSCIKQFWTSAKVKTVNEDVRLQALVDRKKVIVNEASIRCDLRLDDAEGTTCLPNAAIFEEFTRIWKQRKDTEVPHTEPQTKKHITTPSHDPLPSGEDRMQLSQLMEICTKLSDMVLSLEQIKTNQAAKIKKLKKRVKKLEGKKKKRTHRLKRLYKVGLTARIESSEEEEGLGDQYDASKHERIAEIDADEDLSLINKTTQDQGRMNDEDLFGVNDLDGDEVIMDVATSENVEQDATVAEKEVSTTDLVTTASEVVTTAENVEVAVAATTPQISKDDVTLARTSIEIKAAKPMTRGVIVQEPSEFRITSYLQPSQLSQAKDKEVARKLDAQIKAEMEEEERKAREKNEANIAVIEEWDDVQATINVDRQLAEQLQAQEREWLYIKERSKLLAKLIESRRKYFAAKRAEAIRNKPPTKAQQKSLMCIYMKNMEGYKQKDFKGKSFDAIKKMFDKVYKRLNTFVAMDSEVMEGSKKTQAEVTKSSSKRAGDEIEHESAKRQRLKKEDDTAELKRCLEIVPEDDDDVTIEATPLSCKSPTIVDYKIYKEGKKSYFKIIRVDGNSQNYLTFRTMFKNFNREDLEFLRSIVKEIFKKIKPVNDMDNLLFQTLKTMFENHVEDNIWKYQQGTEILIKKLEDSEGEHQVYGRIVGIKGLHEVTTAQKLRLRRDEDRKYAK
nr:hypothetical protein [Tanacetum cinerariifolium]